jgi:hypothetical protein
VCVPTASELLDHVAWPLLFNVAVVSEAEPSRNVTDPMLTALPADCTVLVNVTRLPEFA